MNSTEVHFMRYLACGFQKTQVMNIQERLTDSSSVAESKQTNNTDLKAPLAEDS